MFLLDLKQHQPKRRQNWKPISSWWFKNNYVIGPIANIYQNSLPSCVNETIFKIVWNKIF